MCPACYINALLLFIFGASGAALTSNIYFQIAMGLLMVGGLYWMYLGYKTNQGKGGLWRNIRTTIIYILLFGAGYVTAAYQTHAVWAPGPHHEVIEQGAEIIE